MEGVLPWLVRWACRAGTKDFCSALAALVGPIQNSLFFTVHYFNSFFSTAQEAGSPFSKYVSLDKTLMENQFLSGIRNENVTRIFLDNILQYFLYS
jgi:hypothetical protein